MKNYKWIWTCLVLASLICLYSCLDYCRSKGCKRILEPSSEFLRYWHFKKGSYWIYCLNNDTNKLDTVLVLRDLQGQYGTCEYVGPSCSKWYGLEASHSYSKIYTPHSTYSKYIETLHTDISQTDIISFSSPYGVYTGYDRCAFQTLGYGTLNLVDTQSIVIENRKYYNTAHLKTRTDTTNPIHIGKLITNQYWVKDVGLVKYTVLGGDYWTLKKYEIQK